MKYKLKGNCLPSLKQGHASRNHADKVANCSREKGYLSTHQCASREALSCSLSNSTNFASASCEWQAFQHIDLSRPLLPSSSIQMRSQISQGDTEFQISSRPASFGRRSVVPSTIFSALVQHQSGIERKKM